MINKLILIVISVSFIGFISCHDTGPSPDNTLTAMKDSIEWTTKRVSVVRESTHDSLIEISADLDNKKTGLGESLFFGNVPLKVGMYPIYPEKFPWISLKIYSDFFEILGGDVLYATYSLDTTKTNWLKVESFDPNNNKILISFQASYYTNTQDPLLALMTTFTEGKIMANVED